MKKIIVTILLITSFSVNAQESKPTKEQTVEFVTNYMKSLGVITNCTLATSLGENNKYFSYDSFKVVGNYLYVSIIIDEEYESYEKQETIKRPRVSKSLIIDLSKTRGMSANSTQRNTQIGDKKIYKNDFMAYIVFHSDEKGILEDGKYEASVKIFIDQNEHKNIEESQIFKAFEHLRKLCGGPEPPKPIKF